MGTNPYPKCVRRRYVAAVATIPDETGSRAFLQSTHSAMTCATSFCNSGHQKRCNKCATVASRPRRPSTMSLAEDLAFERSRNHYLATLVPMVNAIQLSPNRTCASWLVPCCGYEYLLATVRAHADITRHPVGAPVSHLNLLDLVHEVEGSRPQLRVALAFQLWHSSCTHAPIDGRCSDSVLVRNSIPHGNLALVLGCRSQSSTLR